jgi:hypothetical protein
VTSTKLTYAQAMMLLVAMAIPGEIAGIGSRSDGITRAFLLIPCDENHPGIEGCDYSLVEARDAPSVPAMSVRSEPSEAPRHMSPPAALWRPSSRFHFPAFGSHN